MIYIIARQVLVQVSIFVETFAAKVPRQLFVIVRFLGIDTQGTAGAVALCAIDRYIHTIKYSTLHILVCNDIHIINLQLDSTQFICCCTLPERQA